MSKKYQNIMDDLSYYKTVIPPKYKKYFDDNKSHPLHKDFILLKPDAKIELNPVQSNID